MEETVLVFRAAADRLIGGLVAADRIPAEVAAAVMEDLVLWDLQDRGDHRDFLGIRDHRVLQERQEL